jgi:hypothetical protein
MMFADSAYGAAIVERCHTLNYDNIQEVNFGDPSPDLHQLNMRSYMWAAMDEWLRKGCIDAKDTKLEIDLTSPGYHLDAKNRLVLESKKDMMNPQKGSGRPPRPSPDDGDALALTFAAPVALQSSSSDDERGHDRFGGKGWMR